MKTITTIKEVRTGRFRVELIKIDNPGLGTCYRILSKRIGKNARWYNSQSYAWTEETALKNFQRKVAKLDSTLYGK